MEKKDVQTFTDCSTSWSLCKRTSLEIVPPASGKVRRGEAITWIIKIEQ